MAKKSDDIKTTVSVRILFKLAGFVAAILAAISGPSLLIANSYANQQWVSHAKFEKLEKKIDDHAGAHGHEGLYRMTKVMLCEQRHGKDGWDAHANKCRIDLGLGE